MSQSTRLTSLEATLTFADGETVQILLADDADSAWGNTVRVLARSVPVRETILDALRDAELIGEEVDENDDDAPIWYTCIDCDSCDMTEQAAQWHESREGHSTTAITDDEEED